MQEELHELFPARTALVLLAVLWLISVIGVLFFGGITVRSLFGRYATVEVFMLVLQTQGLIAFAFTVVKIQMQYAVAAPYVGVGQQVFQ